jgi:hypothetical protein
VDCFRVRRQPPATCDYDQNQDLRVADDTPKWQPVDGHFFLLT